MKTNRKFKEFKADIQKCISESILLKKNQPAIVREREIKDGNIKILYRGSGIKGKEDAVWFVDNSSLNFLIQIEISVQGIDIVKYSIHWENSDERNIFLVRYDWNSADQPKEDHPMGHFHINRYDIRFPTEKLEFQNVFKCIEDWIEKRQEIQKNE